MPECWANRAMSGDQDRSGDSISFARTYHFTGQRVLDVGCGVGTYGSSPWLAQRFDRAYGVDVSLSRLAKAARDDQRVLASAGEHSAVHRRLFRSCPTERSHRARARRSADAGRVPP